MSIVLLRWAGCKRREADVILSHATNCQSIIEPFCGSAAVSFISKLHIKALGESNNDLRLFYEAIRSNPTDFHAWLTDMAKLYEANPPEVYQKIKTANPDSPIVRAVRLYALNKTCFNGLWRLNAKGAFNVSMDKTKTHIPVPNLSALTDIAFRLKNTKLVTSWQEAIRLAAAGDFVYCDPPYLGMQVTYGQPVFTLNDYQELKNEMSQAVDRGAVCLLSHADNAEIKSIFSGDNVKILNLSARQNISCKAITRGPRHDLLIVMEGT